MAQRIDNQSYTLPMGQNESSIENNGKKKRILHWDLTYVLIIFGIIAAYFYLFSTLDIRAFSIIVALTIGVGICTAVVWKITAEYTVKAFNTVFHFLSGKSDTLCLVKSKQSTAHSILDHLYMAVEWSIFPTLVVFFVLSYIADFITPNGEAVVRTEGKNYWLIYVFMFIIPPLVTFIAIPIRLIMDSSLMRYNIQARILEPFGLTFKRMFRAIGGVGALASFVNVALNKGGVKSAFMDTFTILLYVYPTIFIATIFYGYWHPRYLRRIEEKVQMLGYRRYFFHKTAEGYIALLPLSEEGESFKSTQNHKMNNQWEKVPIFSEKNLPPPDNESENEGGYSEEEDEHPIFKEFYGEYEEKGKDEPWNAEYDNEEDDSIHLREP